MAYKNIEDKKAYHKKYHKEWYEKNKDRRIQQITERRNKIRVESYGIINQIKIELGCADCGYNSHAVALDFDHLSDKSYNISGMIGDGYTIDAIMDEIKKCEVVCANCHRVRTQNRR